MSWRCEKKSGQQRCLNYWDGHEKGHQFSRRGKGLPSLDPSLLVGEFHCTWEPEKLIKKLYAEICRQENGEIGTTFPSAARRSGVLNVRSNRTCFTCLSQCPVYILPCEHIKHTICEQCVVRFNYDVRRSQATLCLKHCPLGCRFRGETPWHHRMKPSTAGVRILSLDG